MYKIENYDNQGRLKSTTTGGSGATNLDGLTDVVITTVAQGDILARDATQFINVNIPVQRIIGRLTGEDVKGLTAAEVKTLIDVDGADVSYTPADATDWSAGVDPGQTDDALDQLAQRTTDAEAKIAGLLLLSQGRLTLTTNTPVLTSDVLAATTLYFTPFKGNRIALYNGTAWEFFLLSERSIAIPATTNTNYDVFIYDNAGTLTLELTAWTNDTTRATALTTQDGIYVKSGATTRRYLGSIRTSSVSGQCEVSTKSCLIWNYYHRIEKELRCHDSTDSWTYGTAAWQSSNNNTVLGSNRVDAIIGVAEDSIEAINYELAINSVGSVAVSPGIGINSVSANSAHSHGNGLGTTFTVPLIAIYNGILAAGYNYLQRLEYSTATGTTTWYGDAGTVYLKTGMSVRIRY